MEGEKAIGVTTFLSIFLLTLAYFFSINSKLNTENELQTRLSYILDAMLLIEQSHHVGKVKIAVGYGACKDLFVKGSEVISKDKPPKRTKHHSDIKSMEELKETYALFFSAGSAAERYISNETLFQDIIASSTKVNTSFTVLGGNAPVMAQRFALEGASVMLAANRDMYLMDSILPSIKVAGGSSNNEQEDIHIIFEYNSNEKWGKFVSPRANRFIIHRDQSNPKISSAAEFGKQLKLFKPNLLVVGGLQMMDSFPYRAGERRNHLDQVNLQLSLLPKSSLVHFEMASFTDFDLLQDLKDLVIPYSDSLGMNEQELPNLHSLLKYNNVSVVSSQSPRVAEVLDLMRDIFSIRSRNSDPETRSLTRIHVHTLAFQAIMVDVRGKWKNTRAAATKAALVAHRHVCHKNEVLVTDSNLLMDDGFSLTRNPNTGRIMFDDLHPVSCWIEQTIYQICIAPVLVCTKVQQTAGGGDNISAAGLILQV